VFCFDYTVPPDVSGQPRLDKYIVTVQSTLNRSQLKSGTTQLLVNGKPAKLSYKIRPGDTIHVSWEDSVPDDIIPEDIPLAILYEDENVTVVNKRQGMVTHPAAGNWSGTLVNALLFHRGSPAVPVADAAALRPGIVHRLDKDTSGIIITANNRRAEEWLQEQFQSRHVRKEYIAIVSGRPPHAAGDIRTGFIRDPRERQKWKATADTAQGKYARTIYHCIGTFGPYSLMRLRIKTGRTHQIRVHMKYIGCPVLGDPLYNARKETLFADAPLMLHARLLGIRLPGSTEYTVFTAPVPARFKRVLHVLKAKYPKELPHD